MRCLDSASPGRTPADASRSVVSPLARIACLLLGTCLLSAAYMPLGQMYLAWIALVPWLMAIRPSRSPWTAFAWGWLGGCLFFAANIWWLWTASVQGMLALVGYLALYWGLAASLLHLLAVFGAESDTSSARPGAMSSTRQPLEPSRGVPRAMGLAFRVLTIAVVWTGVEWLRATRVDPRGFPWMFLGHTQGPAPLLCQVADLGGVFAVSFWVALVNGLVWVGLYPTGGSFQPTGITPAGSRSHPATGSSRWGAILPATAVVGIVLAAVVGYGWYRLAENAVEPGPVVTVIQPNHPHLPGGAPTVSREEALRFHLEASRQAVSEHCTELIVWSESVLPPLNVEARAALKAGAGGQFMEHVHQEVGALTRDAGAWLVAGANHVGGWRKDGNATVGTEIRNSAYLYSPEGEQVARYDKSQLVAFSERVPFRNRVDWLYRLMLWLSPPVATQALVAGDATAPVVFTMTGREANREGHASSMPKDAGSGGRSFRFVTPICLENIFPAYLVQLLEPDETGRKRADFIVNLSNDGWFTTQEKYQHLQNVAFRCIENRVPQVRASNTGISAFIDSCGRVVHSLPPGTARNGTHRIMLDRRVAPYVRWGDAFAIGCLTLTSLLILAGPVRRWLMR